MVNVDHLKKLRTVFAKHWLGVVVGAVLAAVFVSALYERFLVPGLQAQIDFLKQRVGALAGDVGKLEAHVAAVACEGPLGPRLNRLLGDSDAHAHAWFVYPDDNRTQIGVRRIPPDFRVSNPIRMVENADAKFVTGDTAQRAIGSNVTLTCPWRDADIPLWQRDALKKWRESQLKDRLGVTRATVDAIFGNSAWKPVKGSPYAAKGVPSKNVQLVYPITSVDANNLKYGIGDDDLAARGEEVTIWFAGDIR